MSDAIRTTIRRGVGLLFIWVVLIGFDAVDLAVGIPTAAGASGVSLRLLPPQTTTLRPLGVPRLVLRFLRQSLVAGFDVARRAFDPRLPLATGFATCPVGFAPGPLRSAFVALTCLLPGTVAVGDDGEVLVYHCLDVHQPVAAQVAAEERLLRRALRGEPS